MSNPAFLDMHVRTYTHALNIRIHLRRGTRIHGSRNRVRTMVMGALEGALASIDVIITPTRSL